MSVCSFFKCIGQCQKEGGVFRLHLSSYFEAYFHSFSRMLGFIDTFRWLGSLLTNLRWFLKITVWLDVAKNSQVTARPTVPKSSRSSSQHQYKYDDEANSSSYFSCHIGIFCSSWQFWHWKTWIWKFHNIDFWKCYNFDYQGSHGICFRCCCLFPHTAGHSPTFGKF